MNQSEEESKLQKEADAILARHHAGHGVKKLSISEESKIRLELSQLDARTTAFGYIFSLDCDRWTNASGNEFYAYSTSKKQHRR